MIMANYIPTGRTSRILRGSAELQIQTEYACRPEPKITTTVFSRGRVIHKIEQELGLPIASQEEMFKVEGLLRKQHVEVIQIVDNDNFMTYLQRQEPSASPNIPKTITDKLNSIDFVEKVFRIDSNGTIDFDSPSSDFKKKFSAIFKNLHELIDIFQQLPGGKREEGVYAIEQGRLYLLSTGYEFFLVLTNSNDESAKLEKKLQMIIKS
jgi:hypothetical protein